METTVVKEEIVLGRVYKTMSDGRIKVESSDRAPGTAYGTYATIKCEATEEKLAVAKEMVVEDVCRIIREIANEKEEIFIIKPTLSGDGQTVALKFILPTVKEDDYSRHNEELIVE